MNFELSNESSNGGIGEGSNSSGFRIPITFSQTNDSHGDSAFHSHGIGSIEVDDQGSLLGQFDDKTPLSSSNNAATSIFTSVTGKSSQFNTSSAAISASPMSNSTTNINKNNKNHPKQNNNNNNNNSNSNNSNNNSSSHSNINNYGSNRLDNTLSVSHPLPTSSSSFTPFLTVSTSPQELGTMSINPVDNNYQFNGNELVTPREGSKITIPKSKAIYRAPSYDERYMSHLPDSNSNNNNNSINNNNNNNMNYNNNNNNNTSYNSADGSILLGSKRLPDADSIKSGALDNKGKVDPNKGSEPSRLDQEFNIIKKMGEGSFGMVFSVQSRVDSSLYAIKKSHRRFRGPSDKVRMMHEVHALAQLSATQDPNSSYIVRYYTAWVEEDHVLIQMELCDDSVEHILKLNKGYFIYNEDRCINALRDISRALVFLHRNDFVHLDIKPANIFIKGNSYKLGDFGLALHIHEGKVSSSSIEEGDCRYMAKELLNLSSIEDITKCDVFSLGITTFEIATGEDIPMNGDRWHQLRSSKLIPLNRKETNKHVGGSSSSSSHNKGSSWNSANSNSSSHSKAANNDSITLAMESPLPGLSHATLSEVDKVFAAMAEKDSDSPDKVFVEFGIDGSPRVSSSASSRGFNCSGGGPTIVNYDMSSGLLAILTSMMEPDPRTRYTAIDVLKHLSSWRSNDNVAATPR